jgi:ATP-dependent Lon protease
MFTSKEKADTKRLPMMPIRDVVIFPYMMTPFVVGRESSVRALAEAIAGDKKIFLATQHDASIDKPKPNEIYGVGTIVNIVQSLKLPDGNIKVLVEGVERARVVSIADDEGFLQATVQTANFEVEEGAKLDALISRVTGLVEQYVKLSQSLNYETMIAAIRVDDPGKLADTVGMNLQLTIEEKQELLEIFDPADRLTRIAEKLTMLDLEIEQSGRTGMMMGHVTEAVRLPFEVRTVFPDGTTEVMPTAVALRKAQAMGLDLILIAPTAIPPVAKVVDYERWLHENRRKHRGGI